MTRDRVVQFRVSAVERERLDALASRAGVKLSDWIRSRALEAGSVGLGPDQSTAAIADGPVASAAPAVRPAPPRAPEPPWPLQRARNLVGKDSAAMARQRKMNEAKGL